MWRREMHILVVVGEHGELIEQRADLIIPIDVLPPQGCPVPAWTVGMQVTVGDPLDACPASGATTGGQHPPVLLSHQLVFVPACCQCGLEGRA